MGHIKVEKDVAGIRGLCVIEPAVHGDSRGYFMETYNQRDMEEAGIFINFVQDNQSMSTKGVLRGLHFQKNYPQCKLVRVVKGTVFDVAVDLRSGSETYGKWYGIELSDENKKQFLIPRGFAHGFLVLSDTAEFCYKCDDFYHANDEGGIAWNDPEIGIEWPGVVGEYRGTVSAEGYSLEDGTKLNLSEKDQKWIGMHETLNFKKENDMMKKALITGITGQDGSYLAELLLEKGYEVHGIIRRASVSTTSRIDHILDKITVHEGDLSDSSSIMRIVLKVQPDEIYNLAAQSHVQVSFDAAEYTGDVDALGVLRILEAVHTCGLEKTCRIYQASTSELYGKVEECPQNERTPFHPYSPYAVAKQYGFWMMKEYREAYGMYCCNGILFNHESERRGDNFVTRKITLAAGRIACGLQDHLELGNLDSLRDWGYAKDYVECMWLILQQDEPDDYVIATGVQHTVREFTTLAFANDGIEIEWKGIGLDEKGYDKATGKLVVCVNPQWFRPTDVVNLWGDPTKAKTKLGWNPQKTSYEQLCAIMAEHDLQLAKKEAGL